MCLHYFVYLKLFYTHYSNILISAGLALSKIQDAALTLKSKKRGEQNQNCKRETFIFPQQPTFPGKMTDWKKNKCSLGVSLGTRQGGKFLLCLLENGRMLALRLLVTAKIWPRNCQSVEVVEAASFGACNVSTV